MNNAELKARFKVDPLYMGQVLLPGMFVSASPDFHQEIVADYMTPGEHKLCYIAPRGHAKSSLVAALLVLHHIKFASYNQKFVLLVSKTEGHAIALLDTLKNIFSGQDGYGVFAGFFGVINRGNALQWGAKSITLPCGTKIQAKGTGQQVVGAKKDSQRPTLIVVDDPEDMTNTRTAEAMEFNLEWLLRQVIPALTQGGRIMVIGTPQHELCMVETLMKMKGWKSRRWSAISLPEKSKKNSNDTWELSPQNAVALWPTYKPIDWLMGEYESCCSIGRASFFYREYQCIVTGDSDRKFTANQFQYYEGRVKREYGYQVLRGRYVTDDGKGNKIYGREFAETGVIQAGIDLASVVGERRDWSVIFFWFLTSSRKLYQLPYVRFQGTPLEVTKRIKKELKVIDPDTVYIEGQGFQIMVRDTLRWEMGVYYPGMGIKITYQENKEERMHNKLQPFYGGMDVYHSHGNCSEYENELIMFPRAAHDDTMDAGSTGLYRVKWPTDLPHASELERLVEEQHYDDDNNNEDSWMTS